MASRWRLKNTKIGTIAPKERGQKSCRQNGLKKDVVGKQSGVAAPSWKKRTDSTERKVGGHPKPDPAVNKWGLRGERKEETRWRKGIISLITFGSVLKW